MIWLWLFFFWKNLLLYIFSSAFLRTSSRFSPGLSAVSKPRDILNGRIRFSSLYCLIFSRIRPTIFWAASLSVLGRKIINSSPPTRARISESLRDWVSISARFFSSSSPMLWPRVSLIIFNPSASRDITETG